MQTKPGLVLAVAVLLGSGLATVPVARSLEEARVPRGPAVSEAEAREIDLDFFRKRVARDSRSARDYGELGRLYLQRARETGDNEDLTRAEANARRSLELRAGRNQAAFQVLAASLLAQHRFDEARAVAQRLVARDSTVPATRALLAETLLELGRYDEARAEFGRLQSYRASLSVAPRLARWEEIRGRPGQARSLLRQARDEAGRRHGMPGEQIAWFQLRLGDLALRHGRLDEAETELQQGLGAVPEDHRILAALARLESARHRWPRAIDYGERAIARAVDPATLALLYDAYAATGDSARAEDAYRAMAVAVLRQPGPFHRAWSLFLLDHGREIGTVLGKAQEELEVRKDVYGYDLVAWARYRSGRPAEAREPMARALSLGTEDAMLWYHAGMIDLALGDTASARRHLSAALDLNPYWHPFQPAAARAVLDGMNRQL